MYLVADARTLPAPFSDSIDELRIILPWGSLLRSVLSADPRLVALMTDGLGAGGIAHIVVSIVPSDERAIGASARDGGLTTLARSLRQAGLQVAPPRALEVEDLREVRSSWARRLGIPGRRPATILTAGRPAASAGQCIRIDASSAW